MLKNTLFSAPDFRSGRVQLVEAGGQALEWRRRIFAESAEAGDQVNSRRGSTSRSPSASVFSTLLAGPPEGGPHLNGKVERSHRIDHQEFYQLLDKEGVTDDIHLFNEKLREWEDYCNYHRPHGAVDEQTPYERLIAEMRASSSPAS